MKTVIYHNPECSKSCAALDLLKEHGEDVEVIEYLKSTPTEAELTELVQQLNIRPEMLVRRHEPLFRDHFEGKEFTDEEWIRLMVEHPILIERPVVVKDGKAMIGRPPQSIVSIL